MKSTHTRNIFPPNTAFYSNTPEPPSDRCVLVALWQSDVKTHTHI